MFCVLKMLSIHECVCSFCVFLNFSQIIQQWMRLTYNLQRTTYIVINLSEKNCTRTKNYRSTVREQKLLPNVIPASHRINVLSDVNAATIEWNIGKCININEEAIEYLILVVKKEYRVKWKDPEHGESDSFHKFWHRMHIWSSTGIADTHFSFHRTHPKLLTFHANGHVCFVVSPIAQDKSSD